MTTIVFLTMQEVRVCVESETLHMIVKRSNSSFRHNVQRYKHV